MNVDYKLIGKRIKQIRKTKGFTQEVLAEHLNVSIGYVSQVERGITKISLDLLAAISTLLECDVATLISESAIHSSEYLESDIINAIRQLNDKQRKFILNVITSLEQL